MANRQAVVDQLQQRRHAAGCTGTVAAQPINPGNSGESCAGLDQALQNNLNFIAAQQADPDAQSAARIANRQAVVDQLQQRRQAAGCTTNIAPTPPAQLQPTQPTAPPQPAAPPAPDPGAVVCPGSTVTLSGEDGAPAASSDRFPSGTRLRVTNLDNDKSTTVTVTAVSGSCVLLNDAAFDQVREPGKNLIRRARIERVG
ncbi:hypothetical protein [Actinophytocola sp.]|uniref:hypothetical protein n=1 Tax=Actinophytocola sp. TaxID=1872138 RepID=UPI0039C89C96